MDTHSNQTNDPTNIPLWVVAVLALGPAVALGWARFAYGLILPSMQTSQGWTYTVAGSLTTASTLGYLTGAVLTGIISRLLGLKRSILIGMAITATCLMGCALVSSLPAWLVLQFGAGFGGSMVFVVGSIVVANGANTRSRAALGLAIYVAGAGFGIAVAAAGVPLILMLPVDNAWRLAWFILSVFSVTSLIAVASVQGYFSGGSKRESARMPGWVFKKLAPITASYSLYGVGYIGYLTFISALLKTQGLNYAEMAIVWAVIGLSSVLAAFLWGSCFSRLRKGQSLAVVVFVIMIGVCLPLIGSGVAIAVVSALLFGGSMLAAPPAVTHFIRDALPKAYWVSAMASITACFGVGQVIGPELVGLLADHSGSIAVGFAASAACLGLAMLAAIAQRPVDEFNGNLPTVAVMVVTEPPRG